MMGVERKSLIISDDEKRNTAYHEAGHALVAAIIPGADPLHKVTIIPRGMALGVTMQLPLDDRRLPGKDYLEAQLAIMMAGRIAEEIFLNQITTGAGNDIERATEMAHKMVCEWGMSELGPMSFGKKEEQIFLGREIIATTAKPPPSRSTSRFASSRFGLQPRPPDHRGALRSPGSHRRSAAGPRSSGWSRSEDAN